MKLDTLYKKTTIGKTQTWTIEIVDDKYRTISGQSDGKKITNKWTICQPKNVGKKNATTGETQAIKQAEAKHKKKLESGYHYDVENIDKKRCRNLGHRKGGRLIVLVVENHLVLTTVVLFQNVLIVSPCHRKSSLR